MPIGLLAAQPYHYLALFVPIALWLLTRRMAKAYDISIVHNSSLAVSYWEEILFRGFLYGGLLAVWNNAFFAIVVSSAAFGLFHLRNLWWSSRQQVLYNCLYAGLLFGPLAALLRWWSGDIYLGIALHAVNNFTAIALSAGAVKPTNTFLLSKQKNMNWFEYIFSGFWLIRQKAV